MRRRHFFAALGGAAVWPVGAHTREAERVPRVGVLIGFPENDPLTQTMVTAFIRALGGLGWIEGGTVRPSALAVLRLTTSSNVVGCSTGRSAGLVPLRILPT